MCNNINKVRELQNITLPQWAYECTHIHVRTYTHLIQGMFLAVYAPCCCDQTSVTVDVEWSTVLHLLAADEEVVGEGRGSWNTTVSSDVCHIRRLGILQCTISL